MIPHGVAELLGDTFPPCPYIPIPERIIIRHQKSQYQRCSNFKPGGMMLHRNERAPPFVGFILRHLKIEAQPERYCSYTHNIYVFIRTDTCHICSSNKFFVLLTCIRFMKLCSPDIISYLDEDRLCGIHYILFVRSWS